MRSLILSAVLALGALTLTTSSASAYTPRYYSQFHAPYGTVYGQYPSGGANFYPDYSGTYTYGYNPNYNYNYSPSYGGYNSGYYSPYTYNPGYNYYNYGR